MKKRGLSADEQVKAAALCAYATSLPVVSDFIAKVKHGVSDLMVMIRVRSLELNAQGYTSFMGPMPTGGPRRNCFQAGLNAEKMCAFLLRLDRAVCHGSVGLHELEEAVSSDLMYPHVLDTLMGLGFVSAAAPPSVVSSTNVRVMHKIYARLGRAPRSRGEWLRSVAKEVIELIDAAPVRSQQHRRFLAEVRGLITPQSVAWNVCKIGTVLGVSLGGRTKLRTGYSNPVRLRPAILRKRAGI